MYQTTEASVEVPWTCIPPTDQQGATPLVAKKSLFVLQSIWRRDYFSLDLWAQLTGSKDFYGLSL